MRTFVICLALLAGAGSFVHAQDRRAADRLLDLKAAFRRLWIKNRNLPVSRSDQLALLERVARLDDIGAIPYLVEVARDPRHQNLTSDILMMLARYAPISNTAAADLFAEHMRPGDPDRTLAREFLWKRAVEEADEEWLIGLFDRGSVEDRFLALKGLGEISSVHALDKAWMLAMDPEWKPTSGSVVSCGTIAEATRNFEGQAAARLLLLLRKDPRFSGADVALLRDATRLWSRRDLRSYIDLGELAHPDVKRRLGMARFLGKAGIERARAPLTRLALDPFEDTDVRAASAEALGHLRIGRAALAALLARLAADKDAAVREGAVRGLGQLGVREAARALVGLLGGPLDAGARGELARLSGLERGADWARWLERDCSLPRGT